MKKLIRYCLELIWNIGLDTLYFIATWTLVLLTTMYIIRAASKSVVGKVVITSWKLLPTRLHASVLFKCLCISSLTTLSNGVVGFATYIIIQTLELHSTFTFWHWFLSKEFVAINFLSWCILIGLEIKLRKEYW